MKTAQDQSYDQLSEIIEQHQHTKRPLIQVLHQAQELFGYISRGTEAYISDKMDLPLSQVHGVVTFYNFFRTEPQGQHTIKICLGTACHVKGASRIIDILEDELDIRMGATTADGRFTLTSVRCIGACGLSPAMMIDDDVYGNLDREKVRKALQHYRT